MPEIRSVVPGIEWPGLPSASGSALLSLLLQLDDTQWWPLERLRAAQLRQLQELIAHAGAHVPFYGPALREAGYTLERRVDWEMFARIPILRREDIQVRGDALRSRVRLPLHGQAIEGATSGSTGMPIRFARSTCDIATHCAFGIREHLWRRRDLGAKYAFIRANAERGAGAGWGDYIDQVFVTGTYTNLNIHEPVHVQAQWLAQEAPAYLLTYASNLQALARHCIETGTKVPSLREVCSYGEMVPDDLPRLVREAWGVPLTDVYSAEEVGLIALQCPEHAHYHAQAERLIVEVIGPDGAPCRPGETGPVVITTLHNFAMPLIRYAIGDYAQAGLPCPCGRSLPVLSSIAGRSRNMVQLPDGSQRSPNLPGKLWLSIAPFRQFRLLQRSLESVVVRYVIDRPLTQGEARELIAALQDTLGHPFDIQLERLPEIERSVNGKYEVFVCELGR